MPRPLHRRNHEIRAVQISSAYIPSSNPIDFFVKHLSDFLFD